MYPRFNDLGLKNSCHRNLFLQNDFINQKSDMEKTQSDQRETGIKRINFHKSNIFIEDYRLDPTEKTTELQYPTAENDFWMPNRVVLPQLVTPKSSLQLKPFSAYSEANGENQNTFQLRHSTKPKPESNVFVEPRDLYSRIEISSEHRHENLWVTVLGALHSNIASLKLFIHQNVAPIKITAQTQSNVYLFRFSSPQEAYKCSRLNGLNLNGTMLTFQLGIPMDIESKIKSHPCFGESLVNTIEQCSETIRDPCWIQWPVNSSKLEAKVVCNSHRWKLLSF